jgi:Protein of unknown function (DUF3108)
MPELSRHSNLRKKLILFAGVGVIILVATYFSLVNPGIAETVAGDSAAASAKAGGWDRILQNDAFGVGEKLTFDINYGFITAGTATMEVAKLIKYSERPCYQIITRANSNSFFSSVYKVDDKVESLIDAVALFSWRFEKNLREGTYKSDRLCLFDQRNHQVIYNNDTTICPPFSQDALSVLYFVRTQPLEPGKSIFVDNFTDGKLYSLEVRVLRREKVTVDAGTFDCIVVEPLLQTVGVFKHEGKLTVWLTDDRLRMPVLMKSKILVGSVSAELTDYTLGEIEDLSAEVK